MFAFVLSWIESELAIGGRGLMFAFAAIWSHDSLAAVLRIARRTLLISGLANERLCLLGGPPSP
jgi:hypothetical protein